MEKSAEIILNKLKETESKISIKKEHLRTVYVDGISGDGLVITTLTGNKQVVNIAIDDSILTDKNTLEEHLITALNNALAKVSELREKEISAIKKEEFPDLLDF